MAADFKTLRETDPILTTTNRYPHQFTPPTPLITIKSFRTTYDPILSTNNSDSTDQISLQGRINSIRASGKKLYFIDIIEEGVRLQLMVREYNDPLITVLQRGDCIGVSGTPHRSKTGELSLLTTQITLVSPCMHLLPLQLENSDIRFRQRYLDLICNPHVNNIFIKRSKIIKYIRDFLDDDGFMEVDTPVLNTTVGGAMAKPFVTHSNDFNMPQFMRISPELFLKQLIISGISNKIYEIGKQFRNENNDPTHNAEFTSIEMYVRNYDYMNMLELCENLIASLVLKINGNYVLEYDGKQIDFTPPFKRLDMIKDLELVAGITLPTDFATEETRLELDKLCVDRGVKCSAPRTTARLLDKLVGHYLEPMCVNPTFILHHPLIMSPLAKEHRSIKGLTERFELFINCFELANAYTELNDPYEQRRRFIMQSRDKQAGDAEAMMLDKSFVEALEYGLPATGGLGIGIDRLVMLLTGQTSIREVILFPTMKPLDDVENVTLTVPEGVSDDTVSTDTM